MKRAFAFVFAAVVIGSPAVAAELRLSQLVGTDLALPHFDSIISGDKLFDQFEYLATGDMPSAEGVNVIAITVPDGDSDNFGIRFQGGFVDLYGNGPSDALIRYRVTALDPNRRISDAHIYGNPSVIGNGLMQVVETFLPEVVDEIMTVYDVSPGGVVQLVDSAYFASLHTTLHVQKDILAYAQTEGSAATLSFVDQTFSQVVVPEPSVVVILITGLVLLGCFVRRNRR